MKDISKEAFKFAKKNKKFIIDRFVDKNIKENKNPVFIFMAGAPGAGKTELSKRLINVLGLSNGIVRIDADEIREIFKPIGYNGGNSDQYKRGCIKGVEILFDHCLKNKYHTAVDGTFASLNVAEKNIDSAINIRAKIFIIYVYQDPLIAWGFTKIREKEEGRVVEKSMFIDSFFKSVKNVNSIKKKYKEKVEVWLAEKDISNKTEEIKFDINNIDKHLKINYNSKMLNSVLYEKPKRQK